MPLSFRARTPNESSPDRRHLRTSQLRITVYPFSSNRSSSSGLISVNNSENSKTNPQIRSLSTGFRIAVVLNTNHDVRYFPLGSARCYSQSHSSRIAEVDNPGEPDEREMQPGQDHGFLWRLNSYWRFEERDGGVYVECEAISLTRSVPAGRGWLVNPIVRTLPRESAGEFAEDAAAGFAGRAVNY
jgi:hypothetical protein